MRSFARPTSVRFTPLIAILFILATPLCTALGQLTSAHLASKKLGWAIVDSRVLITTNEGATWKDVTPSHTDRETIADVQFIDARYGFVSLQSYPSSDRSALDASVVIARTEDGGRSWYRVTIPRTTISEGKDCCFAAGLDFISPKTGWLMIKLASGPSFALGVLFRTVDGGLTWEKLSVPPVGVTPYFVTENDGWLAGGPAGLDFWRTTNGGQSWNAVDIPAITTNCLALPCRPGYQTPLFTDRANGYLTVTLTNSNTEQIEDLVSSDGGATWSLNPQSRSLENKDLNEESIQTPAGPVHLSLSADGAIQIAHNGRRQVATSPTGSNRPEENAGLVSAGIVNATDGWIIRRTRHCVSKFSGIPNICPITSELLVTQNGGSTYQVVTPPQSEMSSNPNANRPESSVHKSVKPLTVPPVSNPPYAYDQIGFSLGAVEGIRLEQQEGLIQTPCSLVEFQAMEIEVCNASLFYQYWNNTLTATIGNDPNYIVTTRASATSGKQNY